MWRNKTGDRRVNKNKYRLERILFVFCCCALLEITSVAAQPNPESNRKEGLTEVAQIAIRDVKEKRWIDRSRGFSVLVDLSQSSDKLVQGVSNELDISMVLINLLQLESNTISKQDNLPESFSEYYADLIQSVSNLEDKRSIKVLLKDEVLLSGGIAREGIARLGDSAVASLTQEINISKAGTVRRLAILKTLQEMLSAGTIKSARDKKLIEKILLDSAYSANEDERIVSAYGLSAYDDKEAEATLQALSKGDKYSVPSAHGGLTYPVREAASRAISDRTKLMTQSECAEESCSSRK